MAAPISCEEEPFISQFRALVAKFEEADGAHSKFFSLSMELLRSTTGINRYSCRVDPSYCESMTRQLETFKSIYFDYTQAKLMNNEEQKQKNADKLQKIIKQMEHVLHWSSVINPKNVTRFAGSSGETGRAAFGAIFGAAPEDLWGI